MKRNEIINALKEAGKPISIKELSKKTEIPISSLRVDLYRLQEESEIESIEKQGKLKWKLKVSEPIEEKYDKMSKKHTT